MSAPSGKVNVTEGSQDGNRGGRGGYGGRGRGRGHNWHYRSRQNDRQPPQDDRQPPQDDTISESAVTKFLSNATPEQLDTTLKPLGIMALVTLKKKVDDMCAEVSKMLNLAPAPAPVPTPVSTVSPVPTVHTDPVVHTASTVHTAPAPVVYAKRITYPVSDFRGSDLIVRMVSVDQKRRGQNCSFLTLNTLDDDRRVVCSINAERASVKDLIREVVRVSDDGEYLEYGDVRYKVLPDPNPKQPEPEQKQPEPEPKQQETDQKEQLELDPAADPTSSN